MSSTRLTSNEHLINQPAFKKTSQCVGKKLFYYVKSGTPLKIIYGRIHRELGYIILSHDL